MLAIIAFYLIVTVERDAADLWYVCPQLVGYQSSPHPPLLYSDCIVFLSFVCYCEAFCDISSRKVQDRTGQLMREKCHLSCDVDWAGCVHSALQRGGMDGGTAAGRLAGGTGGTGCPESGGSSPEGRRETGKRNV